MKKSPLSCGARVGISGARCFPDFFSCLEDNKREDCRNNGCVKGLLLDPTWSTVGCVLTSVHCALQLMYYRHSQKWENVAIAAVKRCGQDPACSKSWKFMRKVTDGKNLVCGIEELKRTVQDDRGDLWVRRQRPVRSNIRRFSVQHPSTR